MTEHLTAAYGAVEQRCGHHAGGQPGERAGALRQGQLEDERAGEGRVGSTCSDPRRRR